MPCQPLQAIGLRAPRSLHTLTVQYFFYSRYVKNNDSSPDWNETLHLFVRDPAEADLNFRALDYDQFNKPDLLGTANISLKVTCRLLSVRDC